jgi:predicted nucleic acid-binding protein
LVRNSIVLPLNETGAAIAAHIFPRLVPRLDRERRKKAWADIFIAATAVAHNYGLVSHNTKDFELIANSLPDGQRLYLAVWKP